MSELLPCPFCGQAARFGRVDESGLNFGGEFIECSSCGASTNLVFPLKDDVRRELLERWNRRTAPAQPVAKRWRCATVETWAGATIETWAEMKEDPNGAYVLYADIATPRPEALAPGAQALHAALRAPSPEIGPTGHGRKGEPLEGAMPSPDHVAGDGNMVHSHAQPVDFLARLRAFNKERCEKNFKHAITAWNIMEWGCALAGEAGELCNVLKKVKREQDGIAGSRVDGDAHKAIADELADVLIYADLLAEHVGIGLAEAIASKFNETSAKVGYPPVLYAAPRAEEGAQTEKDEAPNAAGLFALAQKYGWSEVSSRPAYCYIAEHIAEYERDAERYREFRRIVYIEKDESFVAYDEEDMDAELDRRIAARAKGGSNG